MQQDKESKKTIIECRDLEVRFDVRKKQKGGKKMVVRAVDGVSLDIREGEILAAVGESGCGKTTLGKAILNIIKPTSGTVLYRGRNMAELDKKEMQKTRSKMQLIYQDPYESLDPGQTAYKTLEEPLLIHRKDLNTKERHDLIMKQLEAVGLVPADIIAERYPHQMSGGQRQRLSIAASVILKPDFVVADEPVSMLDVSVRAGILKLMMDMQEGNALTYLFISHDLSLTWMIADRIAVFYLGKLMEIGDAQAIVHNGYHPYTRALVSVIPAMAGTKKPEDRHVLTGETPAATDVPKGCRFHTRCWMHMEKGCPPICSECEPALREVGEGHMAACHFNREGLPFEEVLNEE